jgi:RNA polymerase sigma-70 factor (ECF subfamily)
MPELAPSPEVLHREAVSPTADPETLVRTHLRVVWRYLRMHGASAHEADDLAQEAFVVALQKGAADLPPAATTSFLLRTARFLFLRLRRDRRGAETLAEAVDALWQRDAADDGGDDLVAALRRCLQALTERARRAVERCYDLAEDAAERTVVASELGLQENGLKMLLQRARQQLRECIERRQP